MTDHAIISNIQRYTIHDGPGIRTEIFPDSSKMKKQMSYANAKQIPFVALAGESEINEGKVTLKNMETGEQQMVTPDELIERLSK